MFDAPFVCLMIFDSTADDVPAKATTEFRAKTLKKIEGADFRSRSLTVFDDELARETFYSIYSPE